MLDRKTFIWVTIKTDKNKNIHSFARFKFLPLCLSFTLSLSLSLSLYFLTFYLSFLLFFLSFIHLFIGKRNYYSSFLSHVKLNLCCKMLSHFSFDRKKANFLQQFHFSGNVLQIVFVCLLQQEVKYFLIAFECFFLAFNYNTFHFSSILF